MLMPPAHADIRRQLKQRLLALPPRAFELFAGDLLIYIGLKHVAVTRYIGDGGIDAHGELVAESGFVRVPAGVQVKRHRHNVQRPDIDRFIGALGGQFHHGIFITTAGYAEQARAKAVSSPFVRIDTLDGDQVVALMVRHDLGIDAAARSSPILDEDYFLAFEAQASTGIALLRETPASYGSAAEEANATPARPEDDLISLQALSYELRVDAKTVRRSWVESGKLHPDVSRTIGSRVAYFFRRDRIETIRQQFQRGEQPTTSAEWRQEFLDFVRSRNLTKSYKPVMLKSLLRVVNRNGEAKLDDIAQEFRQFYLERADQGKITEYSGLLTRPHDANIHAIRQLLIKFPLERFIIKQFIEYDPGTDIVRIAPILWSDLRFYELLDIHDSLSQQIDYYYARKV